MQGSKNISFNYLAVAEIRFVIDADLPNLMGKGQAYFGYAKYSGFSVLQNQSIKLENFGEQKMLVPTIHKTYAFTNEGLTRQFILNEHCLAFKVTDFEDFESFVTLFQEGIYIANKLLNIATTHRMGFRLLKRIMPKPDVSLKDYLQPSEDGISLCKWLRDIHPFMGIVMLTARVMGSERTEGYQAGADVYLTKPTRPEEILAVIRNLMRRHDRQGSSAVSVSNVWTLHQKSMSLSAPDADVLSLTPKETIVLFTLAQTSTHCTYDDLIDKLGGEAQRTTFDKLRLEVVISRLRSKLFKFKAQAFEIKTIHGFGYRLTQPLKSRTN